MKLRGKYLPVFAIALGFSQAAAAEDIGAAMKACRAEPDDSRRLACYDREIDRARSAGAAAVPIAAPAALPAASPAAPPATAQVAAPTELTSEEKFGREGKMTREETERKVDESRALGELQAKVTEIWTRSDGLMVVTLDNGQEWRQNGPDSFFRLKKGDMVRIQPAAMNSFLMSGPSKRSTRVTRLK